MQTESWLRLTDYASKYHVSISTLRRRIKTGHLLFRVNEGKYLIRDTLPLVDEDAAPFEQPDSLEPEEMPAEISAEMSGEMPGKMKDSEEPILSSANQLLSELKRAYMNILHEKEEQIIQLKEEVTDLKTLVHVLEEDNERLRRITSRIQGG